MDNEIKCAIAHFDRKTTDYQIYVDRALQTQDKKIKTHENYLINTLDSQNKRITDFMEENAGDGSKKFELVYDGIIQDVTFDKPYTELYFIYSTMAGHGADVTIKLDDNSYIEGYLDGAEKTKYYVMFNGLGCVFSLSYEYVPIGEYEVFPNANYMTDFLIAPMGEVDNTTDHLKIYAR